eukprot:jgi/Tetstr1/448790/TSEL_036024.t1
MQRAYAESMPPVGLTTPGVWNPRNDEWDRYLTDEKKYATRDEYRHLLCYGVCTASAHAALTDDVETLRAQNATARDTADANDLLDSAICTIATCGQVAEDRLTSLRRFKCKKALTGEERLAESALPTPASSTPPPPSAPTMASKAFSTPWTTNDSRTHATPAQLPFLDRELDRFVESGAWEFGTCRTWVSRLFLVPKPGVNQWRCIIDLRVLNLCASGSRWRPY